MDCVESFLTDFSVDDFLDFSNTEALESSSSSSRKDQVQERKKVKTLSDQNTLEDLLSFPGFELDFPVGDLEDLEWLSNFKDDSFLESYLSGDFPLTPVTSVEAKSLCIPVKPRSKRRKNGRVWSLKSLSSSSVSTGKKKRGKKKAEASSRGGEEQQGRRFCSHCGAQKTPQWRMGPLGAKTLCNACGVRFKSGRLLPEYRPACSPTFSVESHSNSHRKVLELRLKKTANPGPV